MCKICDDTLDIMVIKKTKSKSCDSQVYYYYSSTKYFSNNVLSVIARDKSEGATVWLLSNAPLSLNDKDLAVRFTISGVTNYVSCLFVVFRRHDVMTSITLRIRKKLETSFKKEILTQKVFFKIFFSKKYLIRWRI